MTTSGPQTPRGKRLFGVALCAGIGLLVIIGGLIVNLTTHSSVQWAPLLFAAGIVVLAFAAFLWVRLAR
jgi:hypothetical protein